MTHEEAQPMTADTRFTHTVSMDYPGAVQTIAALEDRIAEFSRHRDAGADVEFVIRDASRVVAAIRGTFRIPERTEAEMDAAHEAAMAEMQEWEDAEADGDITVLTRPLAPPVAVAFWQRGLDNPYGAGDDVEASRG